MTGGARGFQVGTALAIADEMLTLVEKLHERGFVHRDIKPDNFLMQSPNGTGHVCLIDLGISKSWKSEDGQAHIPISKGNVFFGTCRYASVNAHQGFELVRFELSVHILVAKTCGTLCFSACLGVHV